MLIHLARLDHVWTQVEDVDEVRLAMSGNELTG